MDVVHPVSGLSVNTCVTASTVYCGLPREQAKKNLALVSSALVWNALLRTSKKKENWFVAFQKNLFRM